MTDLCWQICMSHLFASTNESLSGDALGKEVRMFGGEDQMSYSINKHMLFRVFYEYENNDKELS